jgi:hypothetical protein
MVLELARMAEGLPLQTMQMQLTVAGMAKGDCKPKMVLSFPALAFLATQSSISRPVMLSMVGSR